MRRRQVDFARRRGLSQRRACRLLSVARSSLSYASRLAERDAPILDAMRELARQYPRYGYRRIQVFLARRGFEMSADRAYRLWRQAGLQVPRRRPRRRVASGRPRPMPPTATNHVWAYDFVFDRCANGQQLKCLTVVDEWTRECLAIEVAGSIRCAPQNLRHAANCSEYSWCSPERIGRAVTRAPVGISCRFDCSLAGKSGPDTGIPGPSAVCGRAAL